MPNVFLSYVRKDVELAKKLEQALKLSGYFVWRDQESIYGGEQWPKVLGEAIADTDFILLLWSKNAAQAHFVEFEWTTAVALRKTIIPCLTDDTPLPHSLMAINGIVLKDFQQGFAEIIKSLSRSIAKTDSKYTLQIIDKLAEIKSTDPEKVVKTANRIFQRDSYTQGTVLQAGRDIYITTHNTNILRKWQSWVILFAAFVLIGVQFDWTAKIVKIYDQVTGKANTCMFSGSIVDLNGKLVTDVEIIVQDNKGAGKTDSHGEFYFKVKDKAGVRVQIIIRKEGIELHRSIETLPGGNRIMIGRIL